MLAVVGARRCVMVVARSTLVAFLMAGDKLPRNAVISGVAVGGLSRSAAIDKLQPRAGRSRRRQPIDVVVNGEPGRGRARRTPG